MAIKEKANQESFIKVMVSVAIPDSISWFPNLGFPSLEDGMLYEGL